MEYSCTLINAKNTRMVLLSEPSNDNDQEMKLNNALIKSHLLEMII
jgi:hypothetical protein